MEVARNSMCHAGAPQFLWPQAVRYAVHQLNLWPIDARPQVMPVSLWTGSLGVAADFRVWGSLAHVVSAHSCLHLSWLPFGHRWLAVLRPTHLRVLQFPGRHRPVPVVSGGAGGAVAEGEGAGAAGAGGVGSGGVGGVGMEVTPVEDTAASTRRPRPVSPPGFPSVPQFPPRSSLWPVAAEPGGVPTGGTGGLGGVGGGGADSGGAGAGGTGTVAPTPCTVRFLTREQRLLRLEREEHERFERAQQ
ncbi:unnamed protein product [Closterium sp. NIES-54]